VKIDEAESSDAEPRADYIVGRGRPPAASRFRPGQSGNPRGRPRNARGLSAIVATALSERIAVTENGRRRQITKLEAAVKQLVNRAAAGETRVTQLVLGLAQAHDARQASTRDAFDTEADAAVMAGLVRRLTERP
jgi:hypothetical protein